MCVSWVFSNKKGYKCYSPSKKKFYYTMDVTFLENQPFYSKTHIQGGESITSKDSEYQFWKLESTPTPLIQAIQVSQPIQNAGSEPVRECVSETAPTLDCDSEPNEPIQISQQVLNTDPKDKFSPQVYSRKPEVHREVVHPIPPKPVQEANPSPDTESPGNTEIQTASNSLNCNDLDIPIAHRKGVRSCTQYPISQFVSYENL